MSVEEKLYFHFTLGPVQGFVAQARRTRDFWAGSFILSWLSAVAMRATIEQGGKIKFPEADEEYLHWLEHGKGKDEDSEPPRQGGVPNRFKAKVPADFDPAAVINSVQEAWRILAQKVFDKDLFNCTNNETEEIWQRQIPHFWDINWAVTKDGSDSAILERRKNWRSHRPPDEKGVKCMMMDGWQELSGEPSPHAEKLGEFWQNIRDNGQEGIKTDLRKGEYLSAIAFVKRRFVRYFEHVKVPVNGWTAHGWELKAGMPSVSYMAAVHWLARVAERSHEDEKIEKSLWDFHDEACKLTKERGEWDTQIRCVMESKAHKKWKALDGQIFFRSNLENEKVYEDQAQAKKVIAAFDTLNKQAELEPVSPFYAMLLMDGDSLGEHMSDESKQNDITKALAAFAREVPKIVQQKNGFLIYAGGDDVLAVLPLEDALECARDVRKCYLDCFKGKSLASTLSGAIEYAHIKMPLTKVLRDAHDLLDNIAKDKTGRDAIAVRVWKPGGRALQWAQPWEIALKDGQADGALVLNEQVKNFQRDDEAEGGFSSKFFYKIRTRFDLLNAQDCSEREAILKAWKNKTVLDKKQDAGENKAVLSEKQAIALMAMEYLNSGEAKVKTMDEAEKLINPLLEQCRPVYRDREKASKNWDKDDCLHADGALLVRFLAHKGLER
ncbi:MAG: type III-B CRISPR-associated protein Cas10/Cmr2 [Gammaproteobacteria bacterium]|nr:type III-B CRISPR-associated protein Cas10/Cmr2 [Gammaproteobacteria bacterium]